MGDAQYEWGADRPSPPPSPIICSYFPCSSDVKVGRPKSVEELAALVAKWPKVKVGGWAGTWVM